MRHCPLVWPCPLRHYATLPSAPRQRHNALSMPASHTESSNYPQTCLRRIDTPGSPAPDQAADARPATAFGGLAGLGASGASRGHVRVDLDGWQIGRPVLSYSSCTGVRWPWSAGQTSRKRFLKCRCSDISDWPTSVMAFNTLSCCNRASQSVRIRPVLTKILRREDRGYARAHRDSGGLSREEWAPSSSSCTLT